VRARRKPPQAAASRR